jgi:hypothetical protein
MKTFWRRTALAGFGIGFGLLIAPSVIAADVPPVDASAPVAAVWPAPVPSTPPKVEKGYLKLGFEYLSAFGFVPPKGDAASDLKSVAKSTKDQIPANVRGWDGKKAVLVGYMMPVKMEKGLVTEFLLMRNTLACCYGAAPNINEWVIVKMKKGVPPTMDVPVEFYGELKVNPIFDNGYLSGIYFLEGERMGEVKS